VCRVGGGFEGDGLDSEVEPPQARAREDALQLATGGRDGVVVELGEVEEAVATELVKLDGVALAISSTAMARGELADTPLMRSVLNNYNPRRSGDIFIVFQPHWFINDFDGLAVATTHGSPWRYDTFVPVMFAGAGLKARTVSRPVTPYDVAPTLANYLGVKPPSGAIGNPLVEVVGD
jgi:hypothetical protein